MPNVRRLHASERPLVRTHLLQLSDADRFMRFSRIMADETLAAYVAGIDFAAAVCLGIQDADGTLIAFAEGFEYVAKGRRHLELAFTTAREWRRQGLARTLFAAFGRLAESSGIDRLDIHCLARNQPMRELLRSVDARASIEDGEVTAQWDVPAGAPPHARAGADWRHAALQ